MLNHNFLTETYINQLYKMNKPKLENTFNYGFAIPDPYMIPEKNILDQDEEEATDEPVLPEKENSITQTTINPKKRPSLNIQKPIISGQRSKHG